jgi:hypothetical protein
LHWHGAGYDHHHLTSWTICVPPLLHRLKRRPKDLESQITQVLDDRFGVVLWGLPCQFEHGGKEVCFGSGVFATGDFLERSFVFV